MTVTACCIVVAGGTSESRGVVDALATQGARVMFSQATEVPLSLTSHPNVHRRYGPLDHRGWRALLYELEAAAVVDAAHPYASILHHTLRSVTRELGLPLVRLGRCRAPQLPGVLVTASHAQAATQACELSHCILLTIGTRHLEEYVLPARATGARLFIRALDCKESQSAVARFGIPSGDVVFARGPFDLKDNLRLLRKTHAGVLVSKDSGALGGLLPKIEAARQADCRVIVIARPAEDPEAVASVSEVLARLQLLLGNRPWHN